MRTTQTTTAHRRFVKALGKWMLRASLACVVVAAFAITPLFGVVSADYVQDRRAVTAVRLFRSLLSADLNLQERLSPEGEVTIVFVYAKSKALADKLAEPLRKETVRDIPIRVDLLRADEIAGLRSKPPAAIFLAEAPNEETLKMLIAYGIEHRVIVYSPFEGHVESGVFAGLSVEAQVRPYINRATMEKSGISLKPFFLKVTKVYP